MNPFPSSRSSLALELSIKSGSEVPSFYGLPKDVYYCRNCVLSNQRPASAVEFKHDSASQKTTVPIVDGLCDACRIHALKHGSIDWKARELELHDLCNKYRRTDGSYDCIVPGSGGKDSIYASHLLKYKYGMNPLTVTWAPHIYTDWGFKNFQSWIHSGFDNYLFTPNGRVHRLLTRLSLETLLHPFQPFIIGQKLFAPALAAKLGIKLVFWGEPEAEDGNPISDYLESGAQQNWKYFSQDRDSMCLSGIPISDLKGNFGLSDADLEPYLPIDPSILTDAGIQVHYTGYYERWHPQSNYYFSVENANFKSAPERTAGTYSKYSGIDDKIDDFHYYTTFIKFGIGRATYDAAQEVRNGDLTRDEGLSLVKRYDGEFPERFAPECFEYLSIPQDEYPIASKMFEQPIITKEYFSNLCDSFRSPHLWMHRQGEWQLRTSVH